MPIKVLADVVDLRRDTPLATDQFLVDSNVWYWIGYSQATKNAANQSATDYPNYLNNALVEGSALYRCGLSLAELAHSIERNEWETFKSRNALSQLKLKEYRQNYTNERQNVVTEIDNAWQLVLAMSAQNVLVVQVDDVITQASLARLKTEALDGYDLLMVEALLASTLRQVITDDADFAQVNGLTIFTANEWLIRQARHQGRLKKR